MKKKHYRVVTALICIGISIAFFAETHSAQKLPIDCLLNNARNRRIQHASMARILLLIKSGDSTAAKALIITSLKQLEQVDLIKIFYYAYENNQKLLAQWILDATDAGAVRDAQGKTLLMLAAADNKEPLVRLLIACKYVDLDAQSEHGGWTALMDTCDKGHTEIVRLLLDAGADAQLKDFEGRDALWWAESSCRKDIVKLLLAHKKQHAK